MTESTWPLPVPCPTCGTAIEGFDQPVAEVPADERTGMPWRDYEYVGSPRWYPCGCEAEPTIGALDRAFEEALERGDLDEQRDQARRQDRLVKRGERILRWARKIGIKR